MNIIGIILVVLICGYIISIFLRAGLDAGNSGGCFNSIIGWIIILFIIGIVLLGAYQAITNPYTP